MAEKHRDDACADVHQRCGAGNIIARFEGLGRGIRPLHQAGQALGYGFSDILVVLVAFCQRGCLLVLSPNILHRVHQILLRDRIHSFKMAGQ